MWSCLCVLARVLALRGSDVPRPPPAPQNRVQLPRTAVSPVFDLITLGTEKVPGLVGQNWDLRVQCQLWIWEKAASARWAIMLNDILYMYTLFVWLLLKKKKWNLIIGPLNVVTVQTPIIIRLISLTSVLETWILQCTEAEGLLSSSYGDVTYINMVRI